MTEFIFSLDNPAYSLPHKIGILGLARVLDYCDRHNLLSKDNVTYSINPRHIAISWNIKDSDVFEVLRTNAYAIREGLIDSPCLEINNEERLVFTQGLLSSYLQHNMHRRFTGEKKEFSFLIDNEKPAFNATVALLSNCYYTSIIPKLFTNQGSFAKQVLIKSNNFPGMTLDENSPAKNLEPIDRFLLLFFLPLETPVVSLAPDLLGQRKGLILIEPYNLIEQIKIKVPRKLICSYYSSGGDALFSFVAQPHYTEHIEAIETEAYILGAQKWNPKQKFIKKRVLRPKISSETLTLFKTFSDYLPTAIYSQQKEDTATDSPPAKTFISPSHLLGFIADNLILGQEWVHGLGQFLLTKQYYEKQTLINLIEENSSALHKKMLLHGNSIWREYFEKKRITTYTVYYRSIRKKVSYLLASPTNEAAFIRNFSKLFPREIDFFYSRESGWKLIRDCIVQSIFLYNFPTSKQTNDEISEQ
jgi:hypothetical protein